MSLLQPWLLQFPGAVIATRRHWPLVLSPKTARFTVSCTFPHLRMSARADLGVEVKPEKKGKKKINELLNLVHLYSFVGCLSTFLTV